MRYFQLIFLFFCSGAAIAQVVTTQLPILKISTEGRTIVDEPKVAATLKIFYKGSGQLNTPTDTLATLTTQIGIEYRGSTSQSFPKKPYGFETWDATGNEKDVSLFGWPKESDYILFASYNEKSLIHNVLSMRIAREMGMYASRTQYVHLYVNNSYEGIYVLMEKIKRDKGRVDIDKMEPTDVSGDELTGGYIIKIDKNTGNNYGSWVSAYPPLQNAARKIEFFYEVPGKDLVQPQREYIRNYVSDFEKTLKGAAFADSATGYRAYADVPSFIKFFLVNEVARNVDGYRISTFLHKDKTSRGGKLKAGPVWDFDISYGNADYCEGKRFDRFAYRFNDICPADNWLVPFWWERFLQDPYFVAQLRTEWDKQRKEGVLQTERLMGLIDELKKTLEPEQRANFARWPILGTYVWPSPQPVPATWDGEVAELRSWLLSRVLWLDANLPKPVGLLSTTATSEPEIQLFPNPAAEWLMVQLPEKEPLATITILTPTGKHLSQQVVKGSQPAAVKLPATTEPLLYLLIETSGNAYLKRFVVK